MANSMYANDAQASTSSGGGGGGYGGYAAASGLGAIMGFKASQAAAKQARLTAEYNAKVAENERILLQRSARDEQVRLREGSDKLISAQRELLLNLVLLLVQEATCLRCEIHI